MLTTRVDCVLTWTVTVLQGETPKQHPASVSLKWLMSMNDYVLQHQPQHVTRYTRRWRGP